MSAGAAVWATLFGGIEDYSLYYKLDVIDHICTLSLFPLVYLYFRSLTHAGPLPWKQYAWLIPGFLVGLSAAVSYCLMGDERSTAYIREMVENIEYLHFTPGSLEWWHCMVSEYGFNLLIFLQIVAGMTYATRNLIRYKRGLSHYFSNFEEKAIENNRAVLIGQFFILGLSCVAFCLWNTTYTHYFHIRHFLMLGMGVSIYYMSYHVSRITFDAEHIITEMETAEAEPIPTAELNETCLRLLPLLNQLIEEEHIFLQPHLSLEDLARQANTNRTYISQIIHVKYGYNFYDFINQKRIEYAQALYRQTPYRTQEQIATLSGFSQSTSFSRIFKKHTGATYREWQKTVKEPSDSIK